MLIGQNRPFSWHASNIDVCQSPEKNLPSPPSRAKSTQLWFQLLSRSKEKERKKMIRRWNEIKRNLPYPTGSNAANLELRPMLQLDLPSPPCWLGFHPSNSLQSRSIPVELDQHIVRPKWRSIVSKCDSAGVTSPISGTMGAGGGGGLWRRFNRRLAEFHRSTAFIPFPYYKLSPADHINLTPCKSPARFTRSWTALSQQRHNHGISRVYFLDINILICAHAHTHTHFTNAHTHTHTYAHTLGREQLPTLKPVNK